MSFDEIVAGIALVPVRLGENEVAQLIAEVLDTRGALDEVSIMRLREHTGWSRSSLYQLAKTIRRSADPVELGPDATFLDALAANGAGAMVFDELAIGMLIAAGSMRRFRQEVIDAGYPMLSEPQLSRRLNRAATPHMRELLRRGYRNRFRNSLRLRRSDGSCNDVWELDEFTLDLVTLAQVPDATTEVDDLKGERIEPIVVEVGERTRPNRPCKPSVSLLVDARSRAIVEFMVLDHAATQADTIAMLATAARVRRASDGTGRITGGMPQLVVTDQGGAFCGQLVRGVLDELGPGLSPNVGYYPLGKGKVERAGQTIQNRVTACMPGALSQLERKDRKDLMSMDPSYWLSFEQAVTVVTDAIAAYNATPHSAHGWAPMDLYLEEMADAERLVVADEYLASLLLPAPRAGSRKVHSDGLHVFDHRDYIDPALAPLVGKTVNVRVMHHRTDLVAVFHRKEFVCFAKRAPHMDKAEREAVMATWRSDESLFNKGVSKAKSLLQAVREEMGDSGEPVNLVKAAATFVEAGIDALEAPLEAPPTPARHRKAVRRGLPTPHELAEKVPVRARPQPAIDPYDILEADLDEQYGEGA